MSNARELSALAEEFSRTWGTAAYDGIRGDLPSWMTAADQSDFKIVRYKLFLAVQDCVFSMDELLRAFLWHSEDHIVAAGAILPEFGRFEIADGFGAARVVRVGHRSVN